jgi:hypothetical protein
MSKQVTNPDLEEIRENANFIEKMLPCYKQCGLYFLFLNSILLLCEYKKILDEMGPNETARQNN